MDKDGNKTGGRQKGSLNKRTQELIDRARELGADPKHLLLKIIVGDMRALGYEDRVLVRKRKHEQEREEYERKRAESDHPERFAPFPELPELTEAEIKEMNLVPLHERRQVAMEMMPYFYSKFRPIEDEDGEGEIKGIQIVITKQDENL